MKVLVVGAGPVGLSAALSLAQNGIVSDVVEKRTEPSVFSRAVGIMPVTLRHFKGCDVSDSILNEGIPFRTIAIHRGSKPLLRFNVPESLGPKDLMIGLPQNRTETIIREAAEKFGVDVQYGAEVTNVATTDNEATATLQDGRQMTYDWIIGADGKNSTVRAKLDIPYPGIDLPGTWSIADVDIGEGYAPEQVSAWIQGESGLFILILPIETHRLRVVSSTPDCLGSLPFKLNILNVRRTGNFQISIRQAETYKKGRVLLAGDSAHCHSPVGGKGMNLGIADAFAVARAIVDDTTDGYTAARHKLGADVLRGSEFARKMVVSNGFFGLAMTNIILGSVQHSKGLQKKLIGAITTL